jgi:hypothetical protein
MHVELAAEIAKAETEVSEYMRQFAELRKAA